MRNAFSMMGAIGVAVSAWLIADDALHLNAFLQQDLRNADSNHVGQLVNFLETHSSNFHSGTWPSPRPWFVWRLQGQPATGRFVVFEGLPLLTIPGTASAAVHLFDPAARPLSACTFSTGWRLDLKEAKLIEEPSLRAEVIELRTESAKEGRIVPRRQVYAFVGSRLALIRLEGMQGEVFRNTYVYPNQTIGPPLPTRTADQWEAALKSDDCLEALEALMWLGGRHLDATNTSAVRMLREVVHEDISEAKLFAAVWARPSVQTALDSLIESKIRWVSEAADLAKTKDTRR